MEAWIQFCYTRAALVGAEAASGMEQQGGQQVDRNGTSIIHHLLHDPRGHVVSVEALMVVGTGPYASSLLLDPTVCVHTIVFHLYIHDWVHAVLIHQE